MKSTRSYKDPPQSAFFETVAQQEISPPITDAFPLVSPKRKVERPVSINKEDPYCRFLETASQQAKDRFHRKLAGVLITGTDCYDPEED